MFIKFMFLFASVAISLLAAGGADASVLINSDSSRVRSGVRHRIVNKEYSTARAAMDKIRARSDFEDPRAQRTSGAQTARAPVADENLFVVDPTAATPESQSMAFAQMQMQIERKPKDKKEEAKGKDGAKAEKKEEGVPEEVWQGYNRKYAYEYFKSYGHPSTKPGAKLQPWYYGDKDLR